MSHFFVAIVTVPAIVEGKPVRNRLYKLDSRFFLPNGGNKKFKALVRRGLRANHVHNYRLDISTHKQAAVMYTGTAGEVAYRGEETIDTVCTTGQRPMRSSAPLGAPYDVETMRPMVVNDSVMILEKGSALSKMEILNLQEAMDTDFNLAATDSPEPAMVVREGSRAAGAPKPWYHVHASGATLKSFRVKREADEFAATYNASLGLPG